VNLGVNPEATPAQQFWHTALARIPAQGWGRGGARYRLSEDEVIERYHALDVESRNEVIKEADEWILDCQGGGCDFFDPFKNKHRYHLSAAVTKLLAMPAFSHIGTLPGYVWHILIHGRRDLRCTNFSARDFCSLLRVARVLFAECGLYCRGCQRSHRPHADDVEDHLIVDPSCCIGSGLHFWWRLGVCEACFDLALPGRPLGNEQELGEKIDAWIRPGKPRSCAIRRLQEEPVVITPTPPQRAKPKRSKQSKRRSKQQRSEQIPLGRRTRAWKAAYDALVELGIPVMEMADEEYSKVKGEIVDDAYNNK
jgi:hypothetical protein